MKCKARVEVIAWVEFEPDPELLEKYGESYLKEAAIELIDLENGNFDVSDIELSE